MTTEEILKKCIVDGNVIKLPRFTLDQKVYTDVRKAMERIGGKWKGGKIAGFVFPTDPTDLLEQIANGKKINIQKEFQFFATPEELADELIGLAKLERHDTILEPSAGRGAIIKAINEACNVVPDCFELMDTNVTLLKKTDLKFNLIGNDFLKHNGTKYSKIIANPPFAKNQDIDHLREMYEILEFGGRVVCITSSHWEESKNEKEKAFREWLGKKSASVTTIESGAFKDSGTEVGGRIIVIDK